MGLTMGRRLQSYFGGRLMEPMIKWDAYSVPTPSFVVEENLLRKNLEVLKRVRKESGAKILLAQKAFSMFHFYPLISEYLDGTTASGIYEARLGKEQFGKETHVFSPAYRQEELLELLPICDHILFNSLSQWKRYKEVALASGKSFGLRVNPECSTQEGHAIYDPCAPGSRLGILAGDLAGEDLTGIDGLHFHTLCEQNVNDLITTLQAFEEKFAQYLPKMKWVNFGGGHHITRADYKVDTLIEVIKTFKNKYQVEVYLEPGEAIALNAGYLVASILDITQNHGVTNAILDTSATCHMPDVLEMPYRPHIINSGKPGEKAYTYQLGGPTCLAGDIIGSYSFDHELQIGDRLIFCDMAIYSMVKTNTFNGMPLASILAVDAHNRWQVIRQFSYEDFKMRLS